MLRGGAKVSWMRTGVGVRFRDRVDAGRRLAERLVHLRGPDTVVLALPRGGVPVAAEVASRLGAPLDVVIVRKLGSPQNPEYAIGAIGENGVRVVDGDAARRSGVDAATLDAIERRERVELERRSSIFRGDRPRMPLMGKVAVLVDDGIATGSTARAACGVVRASMARRIVLAVPVAPAGWEAALGSAADELMCVTAPVSFSSVGQWYDDFEQTPDAEVIRALARG